MAGILSVNISNNINKKKVYSKLSFNEGDRFSARVINKDKSNNMLVLKLPDGWEFEAEIDKPLEFLENESLLKFQVTGHKEGKLQLKLIKQQEQNESENSLERFVKDKLFVKDKKNLSILYKMVKHGIPLNRENIARIKNIVDFQTDIKANNNEIDKFIEKYLNNNRIPLNSERAKEVINILKGFLNELKKTDVDMLLTLIENDIELTEANIKSFNNISKQNNVVYNDIKNLDIEKNLNEINSRVTTDSINNIQEDNNFDENNLNYKFDNINDVKVNNDNISELNNEISKNIINKDIINEQDNYNKQNKILNKTSVEDISGNDDNNLKNALPDIIKGIDQYTKNNSNPTTEKLLDDILLDLGVDNQADKSELAQELKNILSDNSKQLLELNNRLNSSDIKTINNQLKNDNTEININKDNDINMINNDQTNLNKSSLNIKKAIINSNLLKELSNSDTDLLVKNQIETKVQEMKDEIKFFLEERLQLKPEIYNKVLEKINSNINNLKVFNSLSNQYYYLDVPVNFREQEYPCKLIIKDDRKKGKKIDSKNVKIVTSVTTLNMGTVDAYIKVHNNDMNIEIKCDENWMKIFEMSKQNLIEKLADSKYNIYINVDEREKEVNIVNCREFFEDNNPGSIDVKV